MAKNHKNNLKLNLSTLTKRTIFVDDYVPLSQTHRIKKFIYFVKLGHCTMVHKLSNSQKDVKIAFDKENFDKCPS